MTENKPFITNYTWKHALESYKKDKQTTPRKDWDTITPLNIQYLMGRLQYAVLDTMYGMANDGMSKVESIRVLHEQMEMFGTMYHHSTLGDDGSWYTELDSEIFPDGDRLVIIKSSMINPRWKDHTLMVTDGKYGGIIISEEVQEDKLQKLVDQYCDHPRVLLRLLKKEAANNKNGNGRFGVFCKEHGKIHEDMYREHNKDKGT